MGFPKIGLEAVLELTGFNKSKKEYTSGIDQMSGKTEKASGTFEKLAKTWAGVAAVSGSVIGAVYALGKALEFGRAGAAINQTTESFDRLMDSLGQGEGALDRLRTASRGTIDDMTLMSSTLTLVAGASNKLGAEMVDAAPRLLEIAKAANKLNPELGTTSSMYESIATGVKRASPLILDNLGIVIKVGDANEKYAAQLGKTVEALTAEEKQLALLYGTLEAGDTLIDQVGGNVDAATDKFDALTVALKNAGDEAKSRFAPAMELVADAIMSVINNTILLDKNLDALQEQTIHTADNYEDYIDQMLEGAVVMSLVTREEADAIKQNKLHGDSLVDIAKETGQWSAHLVSNAEKLGLLTKAEYESVLAGERVEANLEAMRAAYDALGKAEEEVITATSGLGREFYEIELPARLAQMATERLKSSLAALDSVTKDVHARLTGFYSSLSTGITGLNDFSKQAKKTARDYRKSVQGINADATREYADIKKKYEDSLPEPTTIEERLKMSADAWDEWGFRLQDIIEHGTDSRHYYDLIALIEKPPDIDPAEWAEKLKEMFYSGELEQLINTSAEAWIDHKNTAKAAMDEETEAVRVATAEQLRITAEAKAEADRQRKEERKDFILMTALKLADSIGILDQWAQDTQGIMWEAFDTPEEVFAGLKNNILALDPALQEIISGGMTGLLTSFKTLKTDGKKTQPVLDEMFAKAQEDSTTVAENIKTLTSDLAEFQKQIDENDLLAMLPADDAAAATADITASIGEIKGKLDELSAGPDDPEDMFVKHFHDWWVKVAEDALPLVETEMGNVETAMNTLAGAVHTKTGDMGADWREMAKDITDYLDGIPKTITIQIAYEESTMRQHGGPVSPGRAYTVGEAGPETFVPSRPGTILPNMGGVNLPAMSPMGAGGNTTNTNSIGGDRITVNVQDNVSAALVAAMISGRRQQKLDSFMGR